MSSKLDDLYDKALKAAREGKPRRSKSYGGRVSLDVPGTGKRYYVVIGFHGKTMQQIADGVLTGVRGISSCKEVVPLWFTMGRDAIIVMNAASARKLNNLVEVKYDDPESLLANGMAVLHRLYDKKQTPGGGQQVMLRLVDAMKGGFEKVPGLAQKIAENEVRYFDGRTLADQSSDLSFAYQHYLEDGGEPLSSVDHVARWLHEKAPEVIRGWNPRQGLKLMTVPDWKYLVRFAAKSLGAQYEEECEVLVSDETLRIPKGSYLYVAPGGYEEKREALVEKWLPQLEEQYARVFIVNPTERARARSMGIIHKRSFDSRKARGLL
jgi:hypothetical protein